MNRRPGQRPWREYKWLPKQLDKRLPETQPENGLLHTPDSCNHSEREHKFPVKIRLPTGREVYISECCYSMAAIAAVKTYHNKGGEFQVTPGVGFEWWFDPCLLIMDPINPSSSRSNKPR